jgi:hypothetical protein
MSKLNQNILLMIICGIGMCLDTAAVVIFRIDFVWAVMAMFVFGLLFIYAFNNYKDLR